MYNFESFNLPDFLKNSLNELGLKTPTPIQAAAIPLALNGKDLLASAETGSGKTLAYSLPVINNLILNSQNIALILVPTRELAIQVNNSLKQLLGRKPPFGVALLIGGEEMRKQFSQLQKRPRIIIGTPGRVCDHLNRTSLKLNNAHFLILDETDRMLDFGFSDQLEYILKHLPAERQTLMFSATIPNNITKLSQKYLTDPQRVQVGEVNKPAPLIEQTIIELPSSKAKFEALLKILSDKNDESSIVFVKTKRDAHELSEQLRDNSLNSGAMHGDLSQRQRDRVMKNFRNQTINIIVATDIAARGLDVPHIKYVINYSLPECPEDYIHRIGRTGRAGAVGYAFSLISREDTRKWQAIVSLTKSKLPALNMPANDAGSKNNRSYSKNSFNKFDNRSEGTTRKNRDNNFRDNNFRDNNFRSKNKFADDNKFSPRSADFSQSSSRFERDNMEKSDKIYNKTSSFRNRDSSDFRNKDSSEKKFSPSEWSNNRNSKRKFDNPNSDRNNSFNNFAKKKRRFFE